MIAGSVDLTGELRPVKKPTGSPSIGRGCRRGCLLCGLALVLFVLVGVAGLGLPYVYWHHLRNAQVFEGPDRVTLFLEVERDMRRPGLFPAAYPYRFPAALLRIDVFPDGRFERTTLRFDLDDYITFNTNNYTVVRLADGFYLLTMVGDVPMPAYRLGLDRIEALSSEDAIRATGQDMLQAGRDQFDLSKMDAVSVARGWRRINQEHVGPYQMLGSGPIDSTRLGVRLRHVPRWLHEGEPESIVAESLSPTERWARTLIELDTRPWKAYKSPTDRTYLRTKYVASPAR
jgi:hypothetical protein